jgi:hypothetical protein
MFTAAGRTALHSLALSQGAHAANRHSGKMVSKVYSEQVNIGPVTDLRAAAWREHPDTDN